MAQRPGQPIHADEARQSMSDRVNIAIATPCSDWVRAGFAKDLAIVCGYTAIYDIDYSVLQCRGSILPQMRAQLVTQALEHGSTHVLFLDSDMRFPKDTVLRLLAHDAAIVGTNYPRRSHPAVPTAETAVREFLYTEPDSTGTADVLRMGFGCCLIRRDVFEAIPKPWFAIGYSDGHQGYVG